eukprot:c18644_g1_i1.p1 GENE.c18644_g1_i1~~c18644_g1_i1.p1  ORF type:complete len:1059 (-),score=262.17 c18644_g1_i1:55-3231(-)
MAQSTSEAKVPDFETFIQNAGGTLVKLKGFSNLPKRHQTEKFVCANRNWQLLVFPDGNEASHNAVSVFLVCPDDEPVPVHAHFQLAVLDTRDIRNSVFNDAQHNFDKGGDDWGFASLIQISNLFSDKRGFVVDDTVQIYVFVKVLEPKAKEDALGSRQATGYVGLKNQGATCYMNSLLQTYFHIGQFREVVFGVPCLPGPTDTDERPNLCFALQTVFWQLQHSSHAVDTKQLTRSFGWDSHDSFTQHDVQEMNAVLVDKLQEKMKQTPMEGEVSRMLEGKVLKYIRCLNVDYNSERVENILDIQLNIKGFENLTESLTKYCCEERLEGDNKYNAESHGMQDAIMGVKFKELPPILLMHLMRYEYDPETDTQVKINDRFEFEETIDMSPFCHEGEGQDHHYSLFSVMVHSGDVSGGHYYAFIKPMRSEDTREQWYRFDDDLVTMATHKAAVADNFGGVDETAFRPPLPIARRPAAKRFASAYMLAYVKTSQIPTLLRPVPREAIPASLREYFESLDAKEQVEQENKKTAHLFTMVHVLTNKHLCEHLNQVEMPLEEEAIKIRAKKDDMLVDMLPAIASESGIRPDDMLLFSVQPRRRSEMVRIERRVTDLEVRINGDHGPIILFVDDKTRHPNRSEDDLLLICKLYTPNQLRCFGTFYVHPQDCLSDMIEGARQLFPESERDSSFVVYEENSLENTKQLHGMTNTFEHFGLFQGDIIVLQPTTMLIQQGRDDMNTYMRQLRHRVTVLFKSAPDEDEPSPIVVAEGTVIFPPEEPRQLREVELELSGEMTYDQVASALGAAINVEPAHIRLVTANPYTKAPLQRLSRRQGALLCDILKPNGAVGVEEETNLLFFDILEFPMSELNNKTIVALQFCSLDCKLSPTVRFLIDKNAVVYNLLSLAQRTFMPTKAPPLPQFGDLGDCKDADKMQLVEVEAGRIAKTFPETYLVKDLRPYVTLRADLMPTVIKTSAFSALKSLSFRRNSWILVEVCHFCLTKGEQLRYHGVPFITYVQQDWTVGKFRDATAKRLHLSKDVMSTWKVAALTFHEYQVLEDGNVNPR